MKTSTLFKKFVVTLPVLLSISVPCSPSLAETDFEKTKTQSATTEVDVAAIDLEKAIAALSAAQSATPAPAPKRKAKVSYDDFKKLTLEVEAHRAKRLVDLNTFLKMSQEPGVIILDARTPSRYASVHVRGAVNLAFTEFTQSNLAKVIPSPDTKILIYCNNNFEGEPVMFATKELLYPTEFGDIIVPPGEDVKIQAAPPPPPKPVSLALNVPTYITLYGYGYRNVYELDEMVHVKDPRIQLEGSMVKPVTNPATTPSK